MLAALVNDVCKVINNHLALQARSVGGMAQLLLIVRLPGLKFENLYFPPCDCPRCGSCQGYLHLVVI
jgi:hypothetical protein